MKYLIDYSINDHVDVYPYDNDDFMDFEGVVEDFDTDNNLLLVRDVDSDEVYTVSPKQCKFTN